MGLVVSALIILTSLIGVCSKEFKWSATIMFSVVMVCTTAMLISGALK